MPKQIASGLIAGKNTATPDATFIWNVEEAETCNELKVKVSYGGGTETDNVAEVHIPWGDTKRRPIAPDPNPNIKVEGDVSAVWGPVDPATKKPRTFVLVFWGSMTLFPNPGNGISSSEKNSAKPENKRPIIVYAHLD